MTLFDPCCDDISFLENVTAVVAQVGKKNARNLELLKDRYGLDGNSSLTLEQVSDKYEICEQRVRQIEKTFWRNMSRAPWGDAFLERLDQQVASGNGLLLVRELEQLDSWFAGISKYQRLIEKALQEIWKPDGRRYSLHRLSGDLWVVGLSNRAFHEMARGVLNGNLIPYRTHGERVSRALIRKYRSIVSQRASGATRK